MIFLHGQQVDRQTGNNTNNIIRWLYLQYIFMKNKMFRRNYRTGNHGHYTQFGKATVSSNAIQTTIAVVCSNVLVRTEKTAFHPRLPESQSLAAQQLSTHIVCVLIRLNRTDRWFAHRNRFFFFFVIIYLYRSRTSRWRRLHVRVWTS
jgi:hypothetical protein